MKRLIIAVLIGFYSTGNIWAQASVIKATRQNWGGGIAGHYGSNYCISIKADTDVHFDSIYLNKMAYKFIIGTPGRGNTVVDSSGHIFTFTATESHFDKINPDFGHFSTSRKEEVKLRQFDGAVLITYYYKRRKRLLPVKELESLPPVAYP